MKRKISFSAFIIAIAVLILLYLGTWQLYRLKDKNHFVTSVNHNLDHEPIGLSEVAANPFYNKVKIQGNFLPGKNVYLYGRQHNKKDGYYLVTPFVTTDNHIILVARGWLPYSDKQNTITELGQIQEITGLILKGEKKRYIIPDNDLKNNIWFTLNLPEVAEFLNLKLEDYYIIQMSDNISPNFLKNINTEDFRRIRNDHLEYAITWYSLAVALVVIYFISKRSRKNLIK